MLRLAEFVVTQASTDYIEVWNSWINTGTLKEVIRVEKNQNYGIYDPSVFYSGR